MPRPSRVVEDDPVEFVGELPPRRGGNNGKWVTILTQLLNHKGIWAKIKTLETPDQANAAAKNMRDRKVIIPVPDHDWGFAARGCEVYAVYRGPLKAEKKRTRRKTK